MTSPEVLEKLCQLFSQGVVAQDPRVAELVPHAGARNLLFKDWKGWGRPAHFIPHKEETKGSGQRGRPKTNVATSPDITALPGATVGGIDTTRQHTLQSSAPKLEEKPLMEKSNEAEELPQEEPPAEEPPKGEPPEEKAKGGIILAFGADEKEIDLDHMEGYALAVKTTLSLKTLMLYQIEAGRRGDNLEVGDFIDECVADYFRGRGVDLGLVDLGGSKDAK